MFVKKDRASRSDARDQKSMTQAASNHTYKPAQSLRRLCHISSVAPRGTYRTRHGLLPFRSRRDGTRPRTRPVCGCRSASPWGRRRLVSLRRESRLGPAPPLVTRPPGEKRWAGDWGAAWCGLAAPVVATAATAAAVRATCAAALATARRRGIARRSNAQVCGSPERCRDSGGWMPVFPATGRCTALRRAPARAAGFWGGGSALCQAAVPRDVSVPCHFG